MDRTLGDKLNQIQRDRLMRSFRGHGDEYQPLYEKNQPLYEQMRLFADDYRPFPDAVAAAEAMDSPPVVEVVPEYETAFMVVLGDDGEFTVDSSLTAFSTRRNARPRDILRGLSEGYAAACNQFSIHTVDKLTGKTNLGSL